MEKIITICFHRLLGIVYLISETAVLAIQVIAFALVAIGLVRASIFLTRTLISTSRLIDYLARVTFKQDICELLVSPDFPAEVNIIPENRYEAAFTLGWLKPGIYLTSGLIENLDPESLDIVIRHELGHCRRRDPLKHMILTAISEILWFIPLVKKYIERHKLLSEVACDMLAVKGGHDRLDVAKTLTSLAANPSWIIQTPKPAMSSINDNLELRVRSLLGENLKQLVRLPRKAIIVSSLIVTLIFLSTSAVLAARYDSSGLIENISTTAKSCEQGHPESDFFARMGIVCPHCGADAYSEPSESTPTCHTN
ncbi:MAG: M56 family metallopeptidase [bacterium]|nr:M56 family metallopeptidase [bacterium]